MDAFMQPPNLDCGRFSGMSEGSREKVSTPSIEPAMDLMDGNPFPLDFSTLNPKPYIFN